MSEKKPKAEYLQACKDIDELEAGVSQTSIRERKTNVPSVPGPSATPTGAGDSGKKIKIASWNIKQLTDSDKLRLKAISRVISTNGFDVVAIQEIDSPNVLQKIIAKLPGGAENWNYDVSLRAGHGQKDLESFGFLYKETSGITLTRSNLINDEEIVSAPERFARKPHIGFFEIDKIEYHLILINVHLIFKDPERRKSEAKNLVRLIKPYDFGNAIILGDFNLAPEDEAMIDLKAKHKSCISGPTNVIGDKEYDNIWIHKDMEGSIDESGVVTEGLKYKNAAGHDTNISDHCPIYVTLSIEKFLSLLV